MCVCLSHSLLLFLSLSISLYLSLSLSPSLSLSSSLLRFLCLSLPLSLSLSLSLFLSFSLSLSLPFFLSFFLPPLLIVVHHHSCSYCMCPCFPSCSPLTCSSHAQVTLHFAPIQCMTPRHSAVFASAVTACQEWFNMSVSAPWRCPSDRPGPSPYEERQPQPSLSLVPGAHPLAAPPDQAHVFHMGWGKDLCASTIILLARLAWWSGTSLERRLAAAFNAFTAWRVAAGAYSSLTEFSLKKFKIKSRLGVGAAASFWGGMCAHMLMKSWPAPAKIWLLRLQQGFPAGCGKGHDVTQLCRWLLHVSSEEPPHADHAPCLHECLHAMCACVCQTHYPVPQHVAPAWGTCERA